MKILVAMSGGIDSSVVAHLLKEQGHELVGVMMKLWVDPLAPAIDKAIPTKCCSLEHIQRARSVCNTLDIPFYVLNLEDEFKQTVVDPFLEDYQAGKTPNPCIECNRTIKFGVLLDKAKELGCEKLATGHYAQVDEIDGEYVLRESVDKEKDQSYYLYSLNQEKLSQVLFPLGGMMKEEVYPLAEKYNVPIPPYYRESQDLCFYPEKEPGDFLRRHITSPQSGEIVDESTNQVVGTHEGLPFYTIGQRKGLGIGGLQIPLHVSRKDTESNTLFVAPSGQDGRDNLTASKIVSSPNIKGKVDIHARINSLGKKHAAIAEFNGDTMSVTFKEPIRGIAAGQSIVWYDGDKVMGGAVIQ